MRRLLPALALAAAAASGDPSGRFPLLDRRETGDAWRFASRAETVLVDRPAGPGEGVAKLVRSHRREYSAEVLAAEAGRPSDLRRTYGIFRSYTRLPDGEERIDPSPLQKRVVRIRREGDAITVRSPGAALPERELEALEQALADDRDPLLPDREAAPGEEWIVEPAVAARSLFPGAERAEVRVRFAGVVEHRGRRCARLRIEAEVERDFGGIPLVARLEGDLHHALDLQRPVDLSLSGPAAVVPDAGAAPSFAGTGRMSVRQSYTWVRVAGAPAR